MNQMKRNIEATLYNTTKKLEKAKASYPGFILILLWLTYITNVYFYCSIIRLIQAGKRRRRR
jgi:hypothetical protein